MEPIFAAMQAAADLAGVSYIAAPDRPVLYAHVEGDNGYLTCIGEAAEEERVAVFYTRLAKAPEPRRLAVAEYVARVNAGLMVGNFDVDMYDGQVRFKTSMLADGAHAAAEHLAALLTANLLTADRYLPGLMEVIFGQVPPGDALERVETFALDSVLHAANNQLGKR